MALKDEALGWWVRNVLMPKKEEFDTPGFLFEQLDTEKNRELLLPEPILLNIENALEDRDDDLYTAGKKYGYRYAHISDFPTIDRTGPRRLKAFFEFFMRAVETIYGGSISHDLDLDAGTASFEMTDFVVCRENGRGYTLSEGGIAGICSYILQNPEIDGRQRRCQGRGDDTCSVVCGPDVSIGAAAAVGSNPSDMVSDNYHAMNERQQTDYVENSLEDMIEMNVFNYDSGRIKHMDTRYIILEIGIIPLLVTELSDSADALFEAAFDYGKQVAAHEDDRTMDRFIPEYLSACGWGDTYIKTNDGRLEVQTHFFPWTTLYQDTSFPIYRGLVSGLLTGYSDRKVRLNKVTKDTKGDGFTVIVSES